MVRESDVAREFDAIGEIWRGCGPVTILGGLLHRKIPLHQPHLTRPTHVQRAAQLSDEHGGGSLTLLGLVEQRPAATDGTHTYALSDFERYPETQRARLEALTNRGLTLDRELLDRIKIRAPKWSDADGSEELTLEFLRNQHIDQLKSLADGHIQLHPHLFASGSYP